MAFILANMKPLKRKNQESYLRLLSLFERELKQYHKVFDNEYYSLHYVLRRKQYTNDIEIRVTMNIIKKPLWLILIEEPYNLKNLLEQYSRYFSVKDVTIVRPFLLSHARKSQNEIVLPKIEERISFEFFRDNLSWRTL